MHPLNDVPTIVEYAPDIFCVYGASEVRIAVMSGMLFTVPGVGLLTQLQKVVPNEVLCARELRILAFVDV